MKKNPIRLIMLLSAATLLASCSGDNGGDNTSTGGDASTSQSGDTSSGTSTPVASGEVYICVYDGGYGTEWLEQMANDFEAKTGIHIEYSADSSILDRMESALRDGGEYDIYMSHDINWQTYAASGYLEPLDDVYASTVEGFDCTFEERLVDGAKEVSITTGDDEQEHYYKVCYTQGAGGFIYNVDMFEENGWSVPTTYDELVILCQTIVDAKIDDGDRGYVTPFTWAGSDREYYWDYPVYEWWYQLAGKEKVETVLKYKGEDDTYANGYEMYNPDTYYKEFMQAYDMWYDLIAMNGSYSASGSYSKTLNTAKGEFINGKAAMLPYAQWGQYELEELNEGALDFEIQMMKTPKATADSEYCNYMVGFGDSAIIPANAYNIEGAKEFLKYLATAEACKTFVEKSNGAFLAFDYDGVDLTEFEASNPFTKSVHEKIDDNSFHLVSTNPIAYRTVNCVKPWVLNKYYYKSACSDPSSYTAASVGAEVYQTAKENWAVWLRTAGLRD